MKRAAILAAKVVIVTGLIFILYRYVIRSMDLRYLEARGDALLAGWPWLVAGQVFLVGLILITFFRWKLLLDAQGIHYSFRESVAIGAIGYFFNQFFLGTTGGDLMKAYYVAVDHRERRAAGITTVFIDRVVGLLDLMALAGAAILLNWSRIMADPWLRGLAGILAAGLAGTLLGCAIFFSERIRSNRRVIEILSRLPLQDLLRKIGAAVYVYKYHPWLVLSAALLSLVVQVSVVLMAVCFARALGLEMDIPSFFFIVPIAGLAASIPIGSPGGLGQLEGAYAALFVLFGHAEESGLVLALLQRLNQYVLALAGAGFYFRRRSRVREARRLAAEVAGGVPPEPGPPSCEAHPDAPGAR